MFTGIVEAVGQVIFLTREESNLTLGVKCGFVNELKIDQSIAHNGACLTVIKIENDIYYVTLIQESLNKTNFNTIQPGELVNLERCLKVGDRLDGHFVTGHIDTVGVCTEVEDQNGSWKFTFTYENCPFETVSKGSITINGVSLTVVDSSPKSFSVCIIPYTFEHTNFNQIKVGSKVNLEFDILGKYVSKLINKQ